MIPLLLVLGTNFFLISTIINQSNGLSVETAIDLTLLGRYYERYADHAVSVARRVYFLVTGSFA